MINWTKIKPINFEKFIVYIIANIGFHNVEWYGNGGGDKGRDVVAYTFEELPFNLSYQRKWIIQCKRWSRFPTKGDILNEVASAIEHKPDFWVLAIPLNPTPDKIDYVESLGSNYSIKTLILPLNVLEKMVYRYPESAKILLNGSLIERDDNYV